MTEKEFLDMVVQERIKLLLERKTTPEEDAVFDRGDAAVEGLDEEKKAQVQALIDLFMDLDAEREEKAYRGGFRDGIRLVARLFKISMEECYGIQEGNL